MEMFAYGGISHYAAVVSLAMLCIFNYFHNISGTVGSLMVFLCNFNDTR